MCGNLESLIEDGLSKNPKKQKRERCFFNSNKISGHCISRSFWKSWNNSDENSGIIRVNWLIYFNYNGFFSCDCQGVANEEDHNLLLKLSYIVY
jgi:hypothetical protein